ncbi:MAG: pseudouridine-5'-phosphate glycosidase [Rhodobacterales bacterium]
MKHFYIAISFLFLSYSPSFAIGEVSTFTLKNGMEIVVIEDHRAPIVTHMVWYKVGSADEPPGKSGIAHYLEHLLFKGTKNLESGEFSKIVAENGGTGNAFTSYDYTGYFQRVAADRLNLMMEIESDRMQNLRLTIEDVLPERDVINEERNSRTENNPNTLFNEHRSSLMYQNHPYGVPVIGYRTNNMPAFYTSASGSSVDYNIESCAEIAKVMKMKWEMNFEGGMVIANPIPKKYSLPAKEINKVIDLALIEMKERKIIGKKTTPFLLSKIAEKTGGKSLSSNIQLVFNNAALAAKIAINFTQIK